VLRKSCGVVIGMAERLCKNDCVKTLNGNWNTLAQKWRYDEIRFTAEQQRPLPTKESQAETVPPMHNGRWGYYYYINHIIIKTVSKIQAAFPRSTAIDRRWRRNVVERGSLLTSAISRPSSFTKLIACSPHTPDVSITNRRKSMPAMMSEYLAILLSSAADTANPASVLLLFLLLLA